MMHGQKNIKLFDQTFIRSTCKVAVIFVRF